MKKITLMILVSLMSFFAYAQLPEYQFEEAWTGSPEAPPNWIVINEFGPLYTWARTIPGNTAQPPFGGTGYSAFLRRETVAPTDAIPRDWLVTRAFPMIANAELKFQARLSTEGNQGSIYKVYITKDTGNPADITVNKFVNDGVLIQTFTEAQLISGSQTVWTEKTLAVPANAQWPAGTNVRIAFVMESNGGDQWFLDNVKVTGLCVPPASVAVSARTTTSASFTWTDAAASNKWEVEIVGEFDTPTQVGVVVNGPLPYTKTGLEPCKRYKIYVRSLCTDGGSSAWTSVLIFNTVCVGENCTAPKIIPPAPTYSTTDNTSAYANAFNAIAGTGCNAGPGDYLGGNDVLYSYTPNTTGNYNIEIKNAALTAGVFLNTSCANFGTSCVAGAVVGAGSNGGARIVSYPLTAGTTYYILVSSATSMPSTPYNLVIQQTFCTEPSAGTFTNPTASSAVLSWTKASTSNDNWQVYVQPATGVLPTTGGTPVTGTPTFTATGVTGGGALQPSTSYEFYVREVCAGGLTYSPWAGPYVFVTTQIPTALPYLQNFESGLAGMTASNGTQVNKWVVGTDATTGVTSNTAYISNDGVANTYAMTTASVTHLYRDVIIPASIPSNQLSLSFDWRAFGDLTLDRLRVWVVNGSYTPVPGTPITTANGTAIGLANYSGSTTWNNSLTLFNVPAGWAGTTRRLVFEWVNNASAGSNPPAAIDNINFSVVTCPQPTALVLNSLVLNQAVVGWTAPAVVPPTYDVFVTQNQAEVPTAATQGTYSATGTSQAITPLTPSATYYVYVRAHCSNTDTSYWTGPLSFSAPQEPATMDYAQNFDAGAHSLTLVNGTQPNKWVVGAATSLSAPNSLYISENNGTTNTYNVTGASVVHAYRDIKMPVAIPSNQVSVSFDWKAGGENPTTGVDRLRAWIVPLSYSPVAGQVITTADGQLLGTYNLSNDTWVNVMTIVDASTWANTTKRIVFEWRNDAISGTQTGAAVDNINVKLVTCPAPTGLTLTATAPGSASFTWTAPAGSIVPSGYDYYYNTTGVPPTAATAAIGTVNNTTSTTITGFGEALYYTVWIRSNCGSGGTSVWANPVNFLSPQTPAVLDFATNFDTPDHKFAVINGAQVNKWMVGSSTSKSAPNSLYISNNGTANAYTINTASVVHAYRDVQVPTNVDQLLLEYDWKSLGEPNDYFRVWLVPVNFAPTPGTPINVTNSNGGVQIGGNFTNSTVFKTQQSVIEAATYAGQVKRLVFEWRNNAATGDQTPAAIDNIKLSVIKCPQPLNLTMTSNTLAGTTFTWSTPASGAPASYEYYYSQSATSPVFGTTPNGNTTANTVTLTLPNSSNFFFYVRSNCGGNGASIWTGPINFNTAQVAAPLPLFQDFEGPTHGFALSSGSQTDKWYYGTATSSSATHSLYISNDEGVTNRYTPTENNVSHTYRDVIVPAGVTQLDIAFDWRAAGQTTLDYLRAWFVPTSFQPVPGTQILPANGLAIGGNYNLQANWQHAETLLTLPAAYQGQPGRIVFEWRSNNATGTNPAGAIDNIDVRAYTCPKPTGLTADQIGQTSARVNWTEAGTAAQWEVYATPAAAPVIPSTSTVGQIANAKPYIYTGLQAATTYQYYVRAICGTNDKSRWAGPFQFTTNVCDVVDQCSINFILTDSGGNGWTENITVTQGGLVVGILGPQLNGTAGPVTVSLPLCKGLPYEVFWNAPAFNSPASREVGLEIVNPFNGQTVFRRTANTLNSEQGTIIYTGIAFCSALTCPQPVNLESKNVVNAPNTTELSWTPVGTETQWEVVAQVQGAGFPSAPGATPTIITVNQPEYVLGGLTPSIPYEFYVRAVCGPNSNSFWSGPLKYSIYTPPACADVVVFDDGLEVIAPDTEYVVCPGEPLCVDFSANYFVSAAQTTSYAVESIPFVPPFPTLGGTSLPVGRDDMWGPRIDLPFEFCFYGNVYDAAQVGANGLLRFDVDHYYGEGSGYQFPQQIPNADFVTRGINNAIYGVMQDTDPSIFNAFTNPNINYQVLGNYPCRALVVSFNELAQFGCTADPAVGAQSSQIVIYEITNIIEVYVKRRVPCTTWEGGRGVIGLQNGAGTQAITPPGRNVGGWSAATPEAWRFVPNGNPTVTFEWLQNGDFYSSDTDINVCAPGTGTTVMTARATYSLCNGETTVRESNFNLTVTEQIVPVVDPTNITKCGNGGDVTVELTDAVADLFADPTGYDITFYTSEQNAIDGVNDIPAQFTTAVTTTIWVRVSRGTQPCFITRSFQVIISNQGPQFTVTPSTSICEGTSTIIAVTPGDFAEADATYAWTIDDNPLPDTTSSITVSDAGVYKVVVTKNECEGTGTSTITVVPLPVADTHEDVTACETYTLPTPSANNKYYTAAGGPTGTGTEITNYTITSADVNGPITVYIYATSPDLATCTAESSFLVTITKTPTIETATANVFACSTYTLPTPAANEVYYTQSGGPDGPGVVIDPTIPIPLGTYIIYVYETSGVDCFAESNFVVKVSTPVVADTPADVTRCDGYELPALTFENEYRTLPGRGGDLIPAGTVINSTQTIYVYAFTTGNDTCFDESQFTVTIVPTPSFNLGGPYNVCQPSNAVIGVNGGNFTDADVTYSWTVNGRALPDSTSGITATEFGIYQLTVTRGDCTHSESVEVKLSNTAFEVIFTDGCDGNNYSVEAIDKDGSFNIDTATYVWTGPSDENGTPFTSTDRVIFPKLTGDYTVVVTSADGCITEETFPVISTTCDIPRGISPNNDGKNDEFDLSGLGVKKLSIFNRYGQEVYTKNNYTNEWHGQGKGSEELPTGTYFYMVERTNGESKTGWVYINRQE